MRERWADDAGLPGNRRQENRGFTCHEPAFDLRVEFEDGYTLSAHCATIGSDEETCYSFGTPLGWHTVSLDGGLRYEEKT
jgi:hypothetical protein